MRELALRDRWQPLIQSLASQLGHPPGIDGFLRAVWRVQPDPEDTEYINSPNHLLELYTTKGTMAGDCDDAATLSAALLAALGWPATFVAIRMPGQSEFSHVFTRAPLLDYGPGYFDIDPIVPEDCLPIGGVEETLEVSIP